MDLAEKEFRIAWKLIVEKELLPVRRKSERELFIQLENGTHIECRSEENPDQLIGEGLDLIICAEAARLKHRTWDQYLRPALADRRGAALLTSTPRGFNWFHEFYMRGQEGDQHEEGWESWQIPSRENPLLSEEEIESARRTSTPEAFAQEWEAKFIAYGGLVFPEFSHDTHVRVHQYNPFLKTALWIDPGISAPYAVLLVQITPEEEIRVLDEIYRTQMTTESIIMEAEERWGDAYLFDAYKNPREDLEVIIDRAAAEAAATWRLRGYRAGGEKPTIRKGIEVHHQFLRDPIRSTPDLLVPRITFDPRCRNAIKEHGLYHYPDEIRKRIDTNPSELPVDIDNHTIDALRYGEYNTFPALFNEDPKREELQYLDYDDIDPNIRERVSLGDY